MAEFQTLTGDDPAKANPKLNALNVQLAQAEAVSPDRIARISELLDNWDNISFEDRREVADGMISQIKATNEDLDIVWKI